jgi:hypothetical protein
MWYADLHAYDADARETGHCEEEYPPLMDFARESSST